MHFADRPTSIAEILSATEAKGVYLLLFLLSLPFVTPIPLPGVSSLFGFVAFLIGLQIVLGSDSWIPKRILNYKLPARFIGKVLSGARHLVLWLEMLLRPRLDFLHERMVYRQIAGILIMLSGGMLLLPLPIPLTNALPAITIVLLAAGAMERDGLFFLAGCCVFMMALFYFGLLAFGGVNLLDFLKHKLFGS